ncbi:hypothetical protein EIP91_010519 [Steccherinum ochraceum]|uniref:Uncharacterized protein n=1 Tax=Steccherinum ochraceum TaxID=92696 RepID=A0A4V2MUX6_9APHY|nr:hypothetical protein EIP91_010519 [Steccherinum ochraceum]
MPPKRALSKAAEDGQRNDPSQKRRKDEPTERRQTRASTKQAAAQGVQPAVVVAAADDFEVQLHPRDKEYAAREPLLGRVVSAEDRQVCEGLLKQECEGNPRSSWNDIIPHWYDFCIAVQVEAGRRYMCLLEVLGMRIAGDNDGALTLLRQERGRVVESIIPRGKIQPVPAGFADAGEESDEEDEAQCDEADNGEVDVAQKDFLAMTVTSCTKTMFARTLREHKDWWIVLCRHWSGGMLKRFFQKTEYSAEDHLAVVDALRAMHGVPDIIAKTREWRFAVKVGQLAKAFKQVTSPSAHTAVQPHSLSSYRRYAWSHSFGLIWDNWTDYENMKTTRPIKQWKDGEERLQINMQNFIAALCRFPGIIPTACNPLSVMFLTTQDAFLRAWRTWLRPSLDACKVPYVEKWDPKAIYRHLMSVSITPEEEDLTEVETAKPVVAPAPHPPTARLKNPPLRFDVGWANIPVPLRTIIFHSWWFANMKLDQSRWAHRPKQPGGLRIPMRDQPVQELKIGTCRHCRHLPAGQQCVQELRMQKRSDAEMEELDGAVITWAEEEDRLPPKGLHGARNETKYRSPKELNLRVIEPDEAIINRCKRQVVRVIDAKSGEHVGGVVYNMFHPETLEEMQASHAKAATGTSIKRGALLCAWQYGDMYAWGFRQAQGGQAGDGYTTYASTKADNIEDIKNIIEVGCDAECMLQVLRSCDPPAFKKIREVTQKAQLNRVGTGGTTSYYCINYMSCEHRDTETTISMSCQLGLDVEYEEDFDFAFLEYGVVFRTVINCGWWFDASKMHGTVVPRHSTVKKFGKKAMSSGIHFTIRKKDMDRAELLSGMMDRYWRRVALWEERM